MLREAGWKIDKSTKELIFVLKLYIPFCGPWKKTGNWRPSNCLSNFYNAFLYKDFLFTKLCLLCCKNVYKLGINSYQSWIFRKYCTFCICNSACYSLSDRCIYSCVIIFAYSRPQFQVWAAKYLRRLMRLCLSKNGTYFGFAKIHLAMVKFLHYCNWCVLKFEGGFIYSTPRVFFRIGTLSPGTCFELYLSNTDRLQGKISLFLLKFLFRLI